MLTPEQGGAVMGRIGAKVTEMVADEIERELGFELTDAQYDKFSTHITDSLTDALAEFQL